MFNGSFMIFRLILEIFKYTYLFIYNWKKCYLQTQIRKLNLNFNEEFLTQSSIVLILFFKIYERFESIYQILVFHISKYL